MVTVKTIDRVESLIAVVDRLRQRFAIGQIADRGMINQATVEALEAKRRVW